VSENKYTAADELSY